MKQQMEYTRKPSIPTENNPAISTNNYRFSVYILTLIII